MKHSEMRSALLKPLWDTSAEAGFMLRMKSFVACLPSAPYIVRRNFRGWLSNGTAGAVWTMKPEPSSSIRARSVTSVLNPGHRSGHRTIRRRRRGGRSALKRTKCFVVQFARDLQPVSNLIPANGIIRRGIFLARNFTVVKTLIFQRLLRLRDHLISANRSQRHQKNDKGKATFHETLI